MKKTMRILHLEDNLMDAEIIKTILKKEAVECEITCVHTQETFEKTLKNSTFDIILSDFSGPDFDGKSSLELCRKNHPETPFIFVSGSIGEEAAIESLRGGATDYVFKEKLRRLAPAVFRAIHEGKEKKERKILEEKLQQAQKMGMVGQLAGGIAHDFNNLLTVILGHLDMLLQRKNIDPVLLDSLRDIHMAAESAGSLTQKLLLFIRKQSAHAVTATDLNQTVAFMAKLLSGIVGRNIHLTTIYAPGTMPVKTDSGMLEQVVMNLVVNARDAMPEGGRITMLTERVTYKESPEGTQEKTAGKFICLTVSDTGTGIPPEVLSRMFDPFFTTKEPGKGTGLGLATVYDIVQQHRGWIEVKSQVGAGSEFRVFLPESDEPLPAGASKAAESKPGRKEIVLIVESDLRSRTQARIYLEEQGYEILDAASGSEALALTEKFPRRIDLLLTEMIMPDGMSGSDLSEKIRKIKPDLRVILTSQYGVDNSSLQGSFLLKPYERQSLTQTVRQCLDSEPPASTSL